MLQHFQSQLSHALRLHNSSPDQSSCWSEIDPITQTLMEWKTEEYEGVREGDGGENGFFACYLLTSLNPRFKGHTYIGFTVNPLRRIRQHNGEIGSGAVRTKTKRPWEMTLCIHGFPTNVSALKFEWAWQHPTESLAVRQAAASFKSLSGLPNKIKLAYTMLSLPAWNNLNITVNYFSTKYKNHSAGCPSLPEHMKVKICPMDELPCYSLGELEHDSDDSLECYEDSTRNETSAFVMENEKVIASPVLFPGSLAKQSSSIASGMSNATVCSEDIDTSTWIEDYSKSRLSGSAEKDCAHPHGFIESPQRATMSSDKTTATASYKDDRSSSSREVEIIDLFTPSPDCSKKPRVFGICPEIIDLTRSPLFIQL